MLYFLERETLDTISTLEFQETVKSRPTMQKETSAKILKKDS